MRLPRLDCGAPFFAADRLRERAGTIVSQQPLLGLNQDEIAWAW